ncbi:MAG: glycoside hydrolase family 57 protein [Fimbriimonadaceae bacterium]
MAAGRFLLCLHSHMPYVLSHGKSPHGTDWIFESAAECYLPLLDVLSRLLAEGVRPRWTVNVTPILAEQLDDPSFQSGFEDYCREKIEAAREDLDRFRASGENQMCGLAETWRRSYQRSLDRFLKRWGRSICGGFREMEEAGCIELVTCAATHGYLPLLSTDESVRAQVRLGVESHTRRFGKKPRGIWLPECAYRPRYEWKPPAGPDLAPASRAGVDEVLAEHGIEYFFVDSHMIRGGVPLGTYWQSFPHLAELIERSKQLFVAPEEARSEYATYSLATGERVFVRDPVTTVKVWSGDAGYPGDEHYLEFHKQLYPGRLRYWRIGQNKQDLGSKPPYEPWQAYDRLYGHARDFVSLVRESLARYRGATGKDGTVVAMYDTELFGHWWAEGPEFLYETALEMARHDDLAMVSGGDVVDSVPDDGTIHLPEGSWGEGGHHSVWLNADNHWTWEKLYPAQRRMNSLSNITVADAKPFVTQCARELLLAEASDWQFLISTWSARDYAEVRFQDHVNRFEQLAAIAERIAQGESPTAEDRRFLSECQQKDAPFPNLDPTIWSKQEAFR